MKKMREIDISEITKEIKEMCIQANYVLSSDMQTKLQNAVQKEESLLGIKILKQLEENLKIAKSDQIPICQDTGMAVIFIKISTYQ